MLNASALAMPSGLLVYITCSVFSIENEKHQEWLLPLGWRCLQEAYIEGASYQADTMYCAIYTRN